MKLPVYLDYSATTPCDPRVVDKMVPYLYEKFGNPASHSHSYGWGAEEGGGAGRDGRVPPRPQQQLRLGGREGR